MWKIASCTCDSCSAPDDLPNRSYAAVCLPTLGIVRHEQLPALLLASNANHLAQWDGSNWRKAEDQYFQWPVSCNVRLATCSASLKALVKVCGSLILNPLNSSDRYRLSQVKTRQLSYNIPRTRLQTAHDPPFGKVTRDYKGLISAPTFSVCFS